MKNKKIKNNKIEGEQTNSEFIPSFFNWIELKEQKEIVKRLEKITKKNNNI